MSSHQTTLTSVGHIHNTQCTLNISAHAIILHLICGRGLQQANTRDIQLQYYPYCIRVLTQKDSGIASRVSSSGTAPMNSSSLSSSSAWRASSRSMFRIAWNVLQLHSMPFGTWLVSVPLSFLFWFYFGQLSFCCLWDSLYLVYYCLMMLYEMRYYCWIWWYLLLF